MHLSDLQHKNLFITINNNHKDGFSNTFYELGKLQSEPTSNSVVLINYSHKNSLTYHHQAEQFFYPVLIQKTMALPDLRFDAKNNSPAIKFKTKTSKEDYLKRVNYLKQHIQGGDIYEINFCIEFYAENINLDPFPLFLKLNALTKAPFAAFAKFEHNYIISASPELFLQKETDTLITKPIKGTAKRSNNSFDDENLKHQLHLSLKERTENVMIVDVARNDLSVIAQKNTVSVPKLFEIETYKTVHQMVSTIECKLKSDIAFSDIISATFPMPSMTGAPKIKAMELIDKYEQFKRQEYSGAIGYIDDDLNFKLSVLIRTIVYNKQTGRLSFAVGSAITHLCDAETEYEECLLKADALLKAMNGFIE